MNENMNLFALVGENTNERELLSLFESKAEAEAALERELETNEDYCRMRVLAL